MAFAWVTWESVVPHLTTPTLSWRDVQHHARDNRGLTEFALLKTGAKLYVGWQGRGTYRRLLCTVLGYAADESDIPKGLTHIRRCGHCCAYVVEGERCHRCLEAA